MKQSNLAKAATLAGRLGKLIFMNPRGLREVSGVALAMTEGLVDPAIDVLPIPAVTLQDLIAEESDVLSLNVQAFPQQRFSITLPDALGLAVLMRRCHGRRVFEFGTHRGVSTTQLAANLNGTGQVFTLDLPRSDTSTKFHVDNAAEIEVANFPRKGDLIPEVFRKNITFLENDSAKFDPGPYKDSMDFIFIDAAHTAEYVKNDSEKAWVMLRSGGIVAWHDCRPQSPDVVRYLRACLYQPRRIFGTTLAFATKPAN